MAQMGYMENRIKVNFSEGESVRIIDGPFEDFLGQIQEISAEKGKMKVSVSMFGRDTLVELEFSQVEKLYSDQQTSVNMFPAVGGAQAPFTTLYYRRFYKWQKR